MREDPASSFNPEPASVRDREGTDPLSAIEDRLLRGARLRGGSGGQGFHVRVEDLLAETGRRGTPRR